MSNESLFKQAILNSSFIYTARPEPTAADLRMSWGLSILLLALLYSRGKKSNFQKLQFLVHAVRLPEGREEVRGLLSGEYRAADVSVRVEPSLNRAVAMAHALQLISIERGVSISLSAAGTSMAQKISSDQEVLAQEREFLKEVAPKMTDALMKRVWRLEDLL